MDNGKEFYQHTKIAKALKAETYFAALPFVGERAK